MSTQSEHNTPMTRRVALKELVPASSEESEIQCSVSSDTPTEIFIPENQEQCKETYTPKSPENSEHFEPKIEEEGNGAFYFRGSKQRPYLERFNSLQPYSLQGIRIGELR
ncbi:hypothetical protein Glove_426g26 [Diversispora epigaea]|uniref:Uncharacterized protein n=1 Tax=Diversispora epigaea TaxID=1348612 RepID=A0A397GU68_9GLOM|nr:hypothetical protein Glove_426g26 [Diversispora epigaea]